MQELKVSDNPEANRLINSVIKELKIFCDTLIEDIKELTNIGIALSSEQRIPALLEMIVDLARKITNADGGTLYIKVLHPFEQLKFEIIQSTVLGLRMGGKGKEITWSPVPLLNSAGEENHANVSAHVALTGNLISIPDVYDAEGFDFSGTKKFDEKNNYRSKSMLVVPLKDHEGEILGVLQLLNAKNRSDGTIITFPPESRAMTLSLASQAAVALTKNKLINDLENLFESFIRTIAIAIDEKSPYTGGHVRRVASIVQSIAESLNKKNEGPFAGIFLNPDQLKTLKIAAWMHDIGKITTPEYVVDKATKLETIYDRIHLVNTRFEAYKKDLEIAFLKEKIKCIEEHREEFISSMEEKYLDAVKKTEETFDFISKANQGSEFMTEEHINRVKEIQNRTWIQNGNKTPLLNEDEVNNLCIKKGTLNKKERQVIENHVKITEEMLNELPFPKKMKDVPEIASGHHETLSGTGYHKGLKGNQIRLETRILALADIFEALSASDRPYKKGKSISEVFAILKSMVDSNQIDKDLYDLFIEEGNFKECTMDYKPEPLKEPLVAAKI